MTHNPLGGLGNNSGGEWLPIETAPKDGTRIQVKGPSGETIGYWHDGWLGKVHADSPAYFGGFLLFNDSHQPTHWRPAELNT